MKICLTFPKVERSERLCGEVMISHINNLLNYPEDLKEIIADLMINECLYGTSIDETFKLKKDYAGKMILVDFDCWEDDYGEWNYETNDVEVLYDFNDTEGIAVLSFPCSPFLEFRNIIKDFPNQKYRLIDVKRLTPEAREANLDGYLHYDFIGHTELHYISPYVNRLDNPEKFFKYLEVKYDKK
jgi:hypothetical protein